MWYWYKAGFTAWSSQHSKGLANSFRSGLIAAVAISALSGCEGDSFKLDLAKAGAGNVPASVNKIESDVESWKEICSMDIPDDLHRWRISDLRAANKPFMVVFGTPQHCTMCVDQLIRVSGLQEKYGDRFAFLHSDGYRENQVWVDWGIKGEPWTFFVDGKGKVVKVFPGPTDVALMEAEVEKLLAEEDS
jgi:uncharacterized protein YceK